MPPLLIGILESVLELGGRANGHLDGPGPRKEDVAFVNRRSPQSTSAPEAAMLDASVGDGPPGERRQRNMTVGSPNELVRQRRAWTGRRRAGVNAACADAASCLDGLDQLELGGEIGEFDAVCYAEALAQFAQMVVDIVCARIEAAADFLVGCAFGNPGQQFALE